MMRTVFQHELSLLDAQMLVMASSMEEAVVSAVKVMEERDAELAARVIEGDDDIDRQERDVESLCLKLLLTQQPVASDLRHVSSALKMVGDMERIGDQSADICDTMLAIDGPIDARLSKHLRGMAEQACDMVHDAVEAFVESDVEKARAVIGSDEQVDELFCKVKNDVIAAIKEDSEPANSLVEALMAAKYLERIADHAENVAEWVEYGLTGMHKGDLIG